MQSPDINRHRIVLIGGAGFLGQHLATALAQSGHPNVLSISRRGEASSNTGVTHMRGNFANKKEMQAILNEGDIVVHLACSSTPATSELNRSKDMEDNFDGTARLLEACIDKKIHKFIFISSGGAVYGNHGRGMLSEETICKPVGAHGAMKLAIEQLLMNVGVRTGLFYTIVRPGNVYGRIPERSRDQGAVEVFLDKLLKGETIVIWGDGSTARDYVYIDDVADFLLRVITWGKNATVYNVGSGVASTLNEVLEEIKHVSGKSPQVHYQPSRVFDVPHVVLNITRAHEELGWEPRYSLRDGITLLYERIIMQHV